MLHNTKEKKKIHCIQNPIPSKLSGKCHNLPQLSYDKLLAKHNC